MQLGKPKPKQNQLMQELEKQQVIVKEEETKANEDEKPQEQYNALTENIMVDIDEKITCSVTKDGDIEKFELKGILYLTLTD